MNFVVAPSILASDLSNTTTAIRKIESIENAWVHLDIMDGCFVPMITFGSSFVRDLRKTTNLIFDVHLMVNSLEKQIELFTDAGADYITFHIEATNFPFRLIKKIKDAGKKAGISVNPSTPLLFIEPLLSSIDLLLLMGVEPGYAGQEFIDISLHKIREAKSLREKNKVNVLISVDGGINNKTALNALEAGADILVMGSYFFSNSFESVKEFLSTLRSK